MGYLFVWQLIAHHSSTGFMLWVTDDRPAQARLEEEQLVYLTEYNQLSDKIEAYRKCQTNHNSVYWVCESHKLSYLGHNAEVQKITQKQQKINRRLHRVNRQRARLTNQELMSTLPRKESC